MSESVCRRRELGEDGRLHFRVVKTRAGSEPESRHQLRAENGREELVVDDLVQVLFIFLI